MTRLALRALTLLIALSAAPILPACGGPGVELTDQTVTVACGACVFAMPDAAGCYWAAEIDGKHHWVQGVEPQGAMEGHAADGMCMMRRQAKVDGSVEHGRLVVTSWELLPATDVPTVAPGHGHAH